LCFQIQRRLDLVKNKMGSTSLPYTLRH
jgi:hypothetical protein